MIRLVQAVHDASFRNDDSFDLCQMQQTRKVVTGKNKTKIEANKYEVIY